MTQATVTLKTGPRLIQYFCFIHITPEILLKNYAVLYFQYHSFAKAFALVLHLFWFCMGHF